MAKSITTQLPDTDAPALPDQQYLSAPENIFDADKINQLVYLTNAIRMSLKVMSIISPIKNIKPI